MCRSRTDLDVRNEVIQIGIQAFRDPSKDLRSDFLGGETGGAHSA